MCNVSKSFPIQTLSLFSTGLASGQSTSNNQVHSSGLDVAPIIGALSGNDVESYSQSQSYSVGIDSATLAGSLGTDSNSQSYSQSYSLPSQSYGSPPAQNYAAPTQSHSTPSQSYGVPSQSYSAPSQSYGTPSQTYGQPSQSYSDHSQSHGASTQTNNQPLQSEGFIGSHTFGGASSNSFVSDHSNYASIGSQNLSHSSVRESYQGVDSYRPPPSGKCENLFLVFDSCGFCFLMPSLY